MGPVPLRAGAVEAALAGGASPTEAAAHAADGLEPPATSTPAPSTAAIWPRSWYGGPWRRPAPPSLVGVTAPDPDRTLGRRGRQPRLAAQGYLADEGLATSIFLALALHRPLLLEGEAGVGKTEVAKVLAAWTGGELLRLQCYEGIDVSQAVYEWDYARQLLHLRAAESGGAAAGEDEVYSERFLVRRPLLAAIDHSSGPPPVLLIDEVDRSDDEFEAFLLEFLSEYAVTVPELGTFRAAEPPVVIITSNRTRDVHDALKRRCLYHWVEHPDFEREVAIIRLRAPEALPELARQVAAAVEALREHAPLQAARAWPSPSTGPRPWPPWAAPASTSARSTSPSGTVLKYQEDQARVRAAGIDELVRAALAARRVEPESEWLSPNGS